MTTKTIKHPLMGLLLACPLLLTACPSDDTPSEDGTESETAGDGDGDQGDGDGDTGDGDGDTGDGDGDTGDGDGDTGDGDGDGDTEPPDPITYPENDPSEYTRVDRAGMPAVNTAVITSKDMYNQADPEEDANGTFVPEITANLNVIHDALDDDLVDAGLVPCSVNDCLTQAGPLVVPDTIKINLEEAAGFPNGRLLADPVIDVTLAVVLLDLSEPGQTATTLAELPLNPPNNDVEFPGTFPYLAEPF